MTELFTSNLLEKVINRPIQSGLNHLTIVSGFASASFVRHILDIDPAIHLSLLIGMAKSRGIAIPDHNGYNQLITEIAQDRFECLYYTGKIPCHAKALHFSNDSGSTKMAFAGSANFTWGGFRDNQEVVLPAPPQQVIDLYNSLIPETVQCTDSETDIPICIFDTSVSQADSIRRSHGGTTRDLIRQTPFVRLSLLTGSGEMHWHSGLNWGQRNNRDRDQAYIPVPIQVHRNDPDFFPPLGHRFLVQTDDGELFWCVMAQENRKGIHTPEDNSILGSYFRKRLGLNSGARVEKEHLDQYGRSDTTFYRIDGDLFFMDFSIED